MNSSDSGSPTYLSGSLITIVLLSVMCAGCIDTAYLDNATKVRKLAIAGRCDAAWRVYETTETAAWSDEDILKYCPSRPGLRLAGSPE